MSNIIETLAEFVAGTDFSDLPDDVVKATKYLFLDSIGCAFASVTTDRGKMSIALAKKMGGPPESSIIGTGEKASSVTASFVNAELINSADYDALIMPGGHVPPYIIPPALAMAESRNANGKDLVTALALGFELATRVPKGIRQQRVIQDGEIKKFSWGKRWGQAWSNFGAAAGAAKMMGLDREQMCDALGISGHLSQVSTHVRFSFSDNRPLTKYGVPGWQNTGGMMAALLAEMGYMGDRTVFDGDYGFFQFCGYEGEIDLPAITRDMGKQWAFTKITYKPYPCCRMLHGGVDCLLKTIRENQIRPEEIEKIKIWGHPTIDVPCFCHKEIENVVDAQFNAAYVFAVAGNGIPIGPAWQDAATMKNPAVLEMMNKVEFAGHPEYFKKVQEDLSKQFWSMELLARGQKYYAQTFQPTGTTGTEGAMSDQDLEKKFRVNSARVLTRQKIDRAVEQILNLEKLNRVSDLMENLGW